MKSVFLSMLFVGFLQTGFAIGLGKQVPVYSDAAGPRLGTVFANDVDKIWTITISLWGGDLLPNQSMKTLSWRLFNSRSGKYINKWTTAVNNSSPVMYPGTLAFSWDLQKQEEVLAAINGLENLKLVLSVDQDLLTPAPTHFVDLGVYCNSHPDKFINLSTGSSGCKAN